MEETKIKTPQSEKWALVREILETLGFGKEEAIAKTISNLTAEEKLEFITYVYPGEDDKLALLRTIADRYGYDWLDMWITKKLTLRTSLMGWRAGQLTGIASEKRREERGFRLFGIFRRKEKKKLEEGIEEFE